MAEFVDMDYAEVEELWRKQKPLHGNSGYASQLRDLEIGVPVRVTTRADISQAKNQSAVRHQIRKALKGLGYEDWAETMIIFHEGRVVVCRPFAAALGGAVKRPSGPTLREIDRREVQVG